MPENNSNNGNKYDRPNSYYEEQSLKAINDAITRCTETIDGEPVYTKPLEEIRFLIHRAYPFGQCKGRPYKIWNRLVLKTERELGLEPKRHAPKVRPIEEHIKQVVDELVSRAKADGKNYDQIMFALRRSYPIPDGKKGKPYQVWCELVAKYEMELRK